MTEAQQPSTRFVSLKRRWWACKLESWLLCDWFVARIPGTVGTKLRAFWYGHYLRQLGKGNRLKLGLRISSPEFVSIGDHCDFATDVFITGGGGVEIGNWVGLGPDVKIWSVNHRFDDPDTPWLLQGWTTKAVVIEDDVWLGANAFVMPGVTIGRGAIVSACAVVGKSIPPYAIVAGNPARVIGWRKKPEGAAATAAEPVAMQRKA